MFEQIVNIEAQYLGCIVLDNSLIGQANLQPTDFAKGEHRMLYQAFLDLNKQGKSIDPVSLLELGEDTLQRCGGWEYIGQVIGTVASVHAFENLQRMIKNNAKTRQVLEYASQFQLEARGTLSDEPLRDFLDKVSKIELGTSRETKSFKEKLMQRIQEHSEMKAEGLSGIDTGFIELNRVTDGWQKTDLIYIGARPSMGKTAFVINSFLRALRSNPNLHVTFFSLEMGWGQIVDRFIASIGGLNLFKMRNPNKHFKSQDEWDRYTKAYGILEKLNIDVRDENTIQDMRAAVRRNISQYPERDHIVFIDYLTLIKPAHPRQSRHHEIEEISRSLKDMARDFNIPVVVLAQLSRAVEQRQNKRPMLSDLRESGAIEQDADMVLFLYRDEYYNPDTSQKGIVEVLIPKNRNGEAGTFVELYFNKETNRFEDLTRGDQYASA
ncbi:replicative DNA helicase [Caldalkalibacillus thermarum TA2.A1]|nr:replicative DNA helicase [Caldalkalibacillus thermarum]QZT34009.1 replicative DNA helicase [Caldalkalibacillus thermarum TA2.A1]